MVSTLDATVLGEPRLSANALGEVLCAAGGGGREILADLHPATVGAFAIRRFSTVRRANDLTERLTAEVRAAVAAASGAQACVLTGSGTQSILLALHAARARTGRHEVICADNVHPSTARAAHVLGMKLIVTAVDTHGAAQLAAYAQATGAQTAAVVVSAPAWARGITDPIASIAAMARDRGAACHVDACIGGFLHPFQSQEGAAAAPHIAAPGVTSASIDLHKFAYAPLVLSAVCYFDADFAAASAFKNASWDGFPYATGALGAEPPILAASAAWAVMRALGIQGYRQLAEILRRRRLEVLASLPPRDGGSAAPYGHVVTLRPSAESLAAAAARLDALGAPAIACERPGFVRLRIDPLAPEADFQAWRGRLAGPAG